MNRAILLFLPVAIILLAPGSLCAQPASEPMYDLEFVNIYVDLFPEEYEAEIIARVFLNNNGSDPVILRCDGNIQNMKVTSDQKDIAFKRTPPYYWFYNIASGEREIDFFYRVRHDAFDDCTGLIQSDKILLDQTSFWYPRNNASDAHQVILNIVSEPDYSFSSNAPERRNVMNNLKRLRTFVLADPATSGLILTGP